MGVATYQGQECNEKVVLIELAIWPPDVSKSWLGRSASNSQAALCPKLCDVEMRVGGCSRNEASVAELKQQFKWRERSLRRYLEQMQS